MKIDCSGWKIGIISPKSNFLSCLCNSNELLLTIYEMCKYFLNTSELKLLILSFRFALIPLVLSRLVSSCLVGFAFILFHFHFSKLVQLFQLNFLSDIHRYEHGIRSNISHQQLINNLTGTLFTFVQSNVCVHAQTRQLKSGSKAFSSVRIA